MKWITQLFGRHSDARSGKRTHAEDITSLRDAAFEGDATTVRTLLESGVDVNTPLPNGDRLVVSIACMGDERLAVTKLLVDHGADVNATIEGMPLLRWIQQDTYCDNERTIAFFRSKGAREE